MTPDICIVKQHEITLMSEKEWDDFVHRRVRYFIGIDDAKPRVLKWLTTITGCQHVEWTRKVNLCQTS